MAKKNSDSSTTRIAVIGQGYVGLPLALVFAEADVDVLALDVDDEKIDDLKAGRSYIRHIPDERIAGAIGTGSLQPSTEFAGITDCSAVVICVPTPLDEHRQPDMTYVTGTGESIAPHLSPGTLVVLESTAFPGATDELLLETLEKGSGLRAGEDFHLAFSPEREDPGNPKSHVGRIPKLVGGHTPACLEKAVALYGRVVDTVVPVSSCRVAEAAKLMENIFRSVNIALVNELKVVYAAMGVDVWEVIEAASSKPFGFMPFYPGPGLGGHCIPIDPFYLTWKAREYGMHTRFIELAGEINTTMPGFVVARVSEALNSRSKPIKGSRILIVGAAYKGNVDDMRESPALVLLDLLKAQGADLAYYDPYIPEIPSTRAHADWARKRSIAWEPEELARFDAAVIATHHNCVDYTILLKTVDPIIDTRNALNGAGGRPDQVWKA